MTRLPFPVNVQVSIGALYRVCPGSPRCLFTGTVSLTLTHSLLAFQRLRSSRTALLDVKAFGLLTVPVGFPG